MEYKDVIRDSKFYVPMNLNLGFLLKDREIFVLMNVINCDNIREKLSVRKLMRYTNRSNNKIQEALTELRTLKLIDGFKPNYHLLKEIFDSLNNAKSIEEKVKYCELYRKSIQQSVSETGTETVSKTGTQIKKMEKEDVNKEDLNVLNECNILNEEKELEIACSEQTESSTVEDEVCEKNRMFTTVCTERLPDEMDLADYLRAVGRM